MAEGCCGGGAAGAAGSQIGGDGSSEFASSGLTPGEYGLALNRYSISVPMIAGQSLTSCFIASRLAGDIFVISFTIAVLFIVVAPRREHNRRLFGTNYFQHLVMYLFEM
jgi:hypothetical protein